MHMIVLEGGVSAGKSTLTAKLAESLDAEPFFEPVETNPYLELYYKDPKKYALAMQFFLMSRRFEQHQQAIRHIWQTQNMCLFDRSIWGDYVFCKKNWLDGNMSTLDFENYSHMRKVMLQHLMIPHITVYLDVHPEILRERITQRGRECEQDIPLSYLIGLNDLYKELMFELKQKGSKVVWVDWNEFKPTEYIVEKIKEYL